MQEVCPKELTHPTINIRESPQRKSENYATGGKSERNFMCTDFLWPQTRARPPHLGATVEPSLTKGLAQGRKHDSSLSR